MTAREWANRLFVALNKAGTKDMLISAYDVRELIRVLEDTDEKHTIEYIDPHRDLVRI